MSGTSPLITSKKARCRASVIGPRRPAPILILSIERIGVISAAVPTQKSSSAIYSASRGMAVSTSRVY